MATQLPPRYHQFCEHVERHKRPGLTCDAKSADYVPFSTLEAYWDQAKLQDIMITAFPGPHDVYRLDDVRKKYLKVFSILVIISRVRGSRVDYIGYCISYGRDDASLPWEKFPDQFPKTDDSIAWFKDFSKAQWMFCPTILDVHRRVLPRQCILPITKLKEAESLDSRKAIGQATITKVQVHPEAGLTPSASANNVVVFKTYTCGETDSSLNELNALIAFHQMAGTNPHLLQSLGSFHWNDENNQRTTTIITEFADQGSLFDIFKKRPPSTSEEIRACWDSLLGVLAGVEALHNDGGEGRNYTSVHQDLKPSNILAFKSPTAKNDYDFILKIADFGMSHTRPNGPTAGNPHGFNRGGNTTYSPPEIWLADQINYRVGPGVDVWAVGCIFMEAAVWIVHGDHGRQQFRQRRISELKQRHPTARDRGFEDCFHTGADLLESVKDVLDQVETEGRKCDVMTPEVVRYILDDVLLQSHFRVPASLFQNRLRTKLNDAVSQSQGSSRNSWTKPPRNPLLHNAATSLQPQDRNEVQLDTFHGQVVTAPNRYHYATGGSSHLSTPLEQTGSPHPAQSQQISIPAVKSEMKANNLGHGFEHPRNQDIACSSSVSARHSQVQANDNTSPITAGHSIPTLSDRQEGTVTGSSSNTTESSSVPCMTIKDLQRNRTSAKGISNNGSSGGKIGELNLLKGRNHIYLVENSTHMVKFKQEAINFVRETAHILKDVDEDGVDLYMTSDPSSPKAKCNNISRLERFMAERFDDGASGDCYMETALDLLVDKIISQLPTSSSHRLSRFFTNRHYRPVSLYVLTSGIWDSSKSGYCGVDKPLKRLVGALRQQGIGRTHISIQFVRFGDDTRGIQRLTYLDNEMEKDYDIIDHKDSRGDVWSILVGSLNEHNDRKDSNPN